MKLYGYWRSSAAYRVRIALNLKGLGVTHVPVSLINGGGEHRTDDFAALNPQRAVPVLELDDGRTLTQSAAIIDYLEETHPDPALLPRDPVARSRVRAVAQAVACEIHPLNNLKVLQHLAARFGADDAVKTDWYRHWLAEGLAGVEALLAASEATGPYCHGDVPGYADCFLVPQIYNAHRYKLDMTPYPLINRINEACLALAPFAQAVPEQQADAF